MPVLVWHPGRASGGIPESIQPNPGPEISIDLISSARPIICGCDDVSALCATVAV